ncbi:DegV family EDD domain-containing protein [Clostridium sp. MCC353]|uniref:DegV family protein n=1 Tax=Clostridium sp. MCC353 TaxID=2592646 RepID=UPI001C021354|nr:DegV family protein [Clostridium sp. MCC353]MBT9777253.1 DegV family EDD domain-containing protein [Clostridium sp. MCC353]
MAYKIIGDSCLDLTAELKKDSRFQMIPLTLQVDEIQVTDDETFDQKAFLKLVKESPNCPKTACPSPESFKEAYECEEEWVFVLTLSNHLSGSYNSAVLAKDLYTEEHGHKNIAVIDSLSASSGELLLALKIQELCEAGKSFEDVVDEVSRIRDRMGTYFVLETLEFLRKNGRLTGLQAFFATALNIKPVMGADKGTIIKLDQARGINKALSRMCEIAVKEAGDTTEKRAVIAHCNNSQRAQLVKEELSSRASFREIVITETAGVATVYAGDGGIVLAVE